jgi:hypothetical protein
MKITFKDKAIAFIFVALGTTAMIFLSTRLVIGALGVCK